MVDYHVDRPGVEALQGVELTGTNRPDTLTYTTTLSGLALKVLLYAAFSFATVWSSGSASRSRIRFLAPIAAGFHPFPSRTRH